MCVDVPPDPKVAAIARKWRVSEAEVLARKKAVERSSLANHWGGFAVKAGGTFFLAGKKSYGGRLWNLADNDRWCNFSCKVKVVGPSLGGGTELGMIFFLNAKSLYRIEGMDFGNGRDISYTVPGKQLGALVKALKSIESLYEAREFFDKLIETAKQVIDIAKGEPSIVYRPIATAELEAGIKWNIQGKIDILGVQGKHGYLDDL